jgi:multicomponent K+:H+ antiporter subunit E
MTASRIFPHPILSVVLTGVWVLLANDFSAGALVLGAVLGWALPQLTRAYWPDAPKFSRFSAIPGFVFVVLWDIIVSNIQVALLILFRQPGTLRSGFVTVPLDLHTAEAITILAGTITMTPGTVSADLSADGRALLVHCLEVDDPDATVAQIKERYERRLKEIFE